MTCIYIIHRLYRIYTEIYRIYMNVSHVTTDQAL